MRNLPTNLSKLRQLINRSSKNLRLLKKKTPLKRRLFRAPAESAKFAQQFVQYDPSRRRDIERTFLTQHGDAHMGIGHGQQLRFQSSYLVSESNTDWELGLPIKQVHRLLTRLNRRQPKSKLPQTLRHFDSIPVMLP